MYKAFGSILAIGVLGVSLLTPAQAQISNIGEAVNQAGLQRMLGQRILKNYGLISLGVKVGDSQKDLTDTLKQYATILNDLQSFPGAVEAQEALGNVSSAWETVKGIAAASPQQDKVLELYEAAEELLQANEDLTAYLVENSGAKAVAIVGISGRQRMLSQRIAALYNLKALGVDEDYYAENLENSTFEFMLALEELKGSDVNNRAVNSSLKKVQTQFKMLDFSVNKKGDTHFPFVVSQAAGKVLKLMVKVTNEYVELIRAS